LRERDASERGSTDAIRVGCESLVVFGLSVSTCHLEWGLGLTVNKAIDLVGVVMRDYCCSG